MGPRYRTQEPVAAYVAEEDRIEAKLFANGRSQAIRLPKAFRMPGDRVLIHREGNRLIVEPMDAIARDAKGHRRGFWEGVQAAVADMPDVEWRAYLAATDDDPVPPPIEIDADGRYTP